MFFITNGIKRICDTNLIQIIEGVKDAQGQTKKSSSLINPKTYRDSGVIVESSTAENMIRNVQTIKMNIAITVTENSSNKAGIGVVTSVFKASTLKEGSDINTITSYVEFDIPISFPVSENK